MIKNLQNHLGLTLNEAKVYYAILNGTELNPIELAQATKLPRSRVYEVLSNLAAKKLLDKNQLTGKYKIIPPKESLIDYLRTLKREQAKKEVIITEISNYLQELWENNLPDNAKIGLQILNQEDLVRVFQDHLSNIHDRAWIAIADNLVSFDMRSSGKILAESFDGSQDIRYLIYDKALGLRIKELFGNFNPFQSLKFRIAINEELYSSFVILDNAVYLLVLHSESELQPYCFKFTSASHIKTYEWLFEQLWEKAELINGHK